MKNSIRNDSSHSKFALGVALMVLGGVFLSGKVGPQSVIESKSFSGEPVKVSGFSESEESDLNPPERIIVPSVNIDLSVKRSKLVNGYWEVFKNTAGWGEGSGVPGHPGNQVIFAHARIGLFKPLRNVKDDAKIYVFTKNVWYSYKVTNIKEVSPDQTEVIKPTDDETLTLYTCSGFADSKRLIVIAKRS